MSTMPMPRSGSSARERANRESLLAERAATECRLGSTNFGSHTCTAVACTCPSGAHRTVCVCLSARSHLFCLCFLASAGSSHVRSAWPIVVPRQRRAELSVHPRMSEPSTCAVLASSLHAPAGPTDCATQSYTVTGQFAPRGTRLQNTVLGSPMQAAIRTLSVQTSAQLQSTRIFSAPVRCSALHSSAHDLQSCILSCAANVSRIGEVPDASLTNAAADLAACKAGLLLVLPMSLSISCFEQAKFRCLLTQHRSLTLLSKSRHLKVCERLWLCSSRMEFAVQRFQPRRRHVSGAALLV